MTADQKEQLRDAALEVLVACDFVPRPLHAIHRNVNKLVCFHFTDEELTAALEFLRGLSLVNYTENELGCTRWWLTTPAGVLKIERANSYPHQD